MTDLARVRELAEVNPPVSEFDALGPEESITFVPLEAVWPDGRMDLSRTRPKVEVANGYARFSEGDVLVPKVTPTFQAARSAVAVRVPCKAGAATTEVHVVRPGPHVDGRYLCYSFQTQGFLAEGVSTFQGVAGLQRVPSQFVRDFRLFRRPLDEQRRVADFLDDQAARIDEIIHLREEEIDLLAERRLEHHRAATTHGGSDGRRTTGVDWMPSVGRGWGSPRLSMLFRFGSGTTPRTDNPAYFDGDVPWINTGDLRDSNVSKIRKTVTRRALSEVPALRVFRAGALAVAMYGATAGRVGLMQFPACVNQACCVLEPLGDVSAEWAFYWFIAHRPEIMRLAYGGGQPNISQETIRGLRIPVPPSARQQRQGISAMHQMDELLNESRVMIEESVELLLERKRSLITAALTGEFDVSTASGRGVA